MYDQRRKHFSVLPTSLDNSLQQLIILETDKYFMFKNQQFISMLRQMQILFALQLFKILTSWFNFVQNYFVTEHLTIHRKPVSFESFVGLLPIIIDQQRTTVLGVQC
ncbi:FLYWCH-type domain-containing protein [Aphis craccivora]|uniref:FLYWCH-type domain-containing protein n=1 Tax=Aphis craccivora TaxID=307492 RepID=A0A6G0YZ67_APHCR|nr:FLYWCH-type domain-containing protein [Aphis craccivora]